MLINQNADPSVAEVAEVLDVKFSKDEVQQHFDNMKTASEGLINNRTGCSFRPLNMCHCLRRWLFLILMFGVATLAEILRVKLLPLQRNLEYLVDPLLAGTFPPRSSLAMS